MVNFGPFGFSIYTFISLKKLKKWRLDLNGNDELEGSRNSRSRSQFSNKFDERILLMQKKKELKEIEINEEKQKREFEVISIII